jgi:hypothetical protein
MYVYLFVLLGIGVFFIAWEMLERMTECQALEAPKMSQNAHAAWLKDYGVRALLFSSPPGFLK